MYKQVSSCNFPEFQGIKANMMPIIFGDNDSIPDEFKGYVPLINECNFNQGDTVYLTVRESFVKQGEMQSRGGVHVESPMLAWGGGAWGLGRAWGMGVNGDTELLDGIYMASNDGSCQIHNEIIDKQDYMGQCDPKTKAEKMNGNMLYWLTDMTPHEALPVENDIYRQFFRLVSPKVDIWFSQHNTKNPLGVKPNCKIVDYNKFEE